MILGTLYIFIQKAHAQNWLGEPRIRLLVPDSLRDEVCREHEGAGHWSLPTIVARARNFFLHPGMAPDKII